MKSILIILLCCCAIMNRALAQEGAQIRFINKDSVYDFGSVSRDEPSAYQFEFKNTGQEVLIISNIKSDDSDIKIRWPNKPVRHGKKGLITVSYVPKPDAGPGSFKTDLFITSNATKDPYPYLHVSGAIMPGHSAPVQKAGKSSGKGSRRGR